MKIFRLTILLLVFIFSIKNLNAQSPLKPSGQLAGGVGMTFIDGQSYYLMSLAPELAFGKFGMGLDIDLRINAETNKLRKEDWDEKYDYLRIIRYLRWGHKGDGFYTRVGALDYARLGNGTIMYLYKNSPSVDERRLGMELDVNLGKWGVETMLGDFASAGVVGFRPYVKPLQFTTLASVPIIGGLEVGTTYATDLRSNSSDTSISIKNDTVVQQENGSIKIIGVDISLPLITTSMVFSRVYVDYAKIVNFGSGVAAGLLTDFNGLGAVVIKTKLERRWPKDKYIPNYFSSFYEIERYNLDSTNKVLESKAQRLNKMVSTGPGYFADITFGFFGKLYIRGAFEKLDQDPNGGNLHFETSTGDMIPKVNIEAGYDRRNITSGKDVFKLDERSLLYATVGYKINSYMIISTLYTWTFVATKDGYKVQKRIQPKIIFSFPLGG